MGLSDEGVCWMMGTLKISDCLGIAFAVAFASIIISSIMFANNYAASGKYCGTI